MKLKVYNNKKEEVKEISVADEIFNVELRSELIQKYLRVYLNNQRVFSARTKTRSEVRGGGRKPWRQKGTGRARHGSIRSPIWVGGGVAHGPTGIKKVMRMNKKERRLVYRMILSELFRRKMLFLVEDLGAGFDKLKTGFSKKADKLLGQFGEGGIIYIYSEGNDKLILGMRNLPHVIALHQDGIDWVSLMYGDVVIMEAKVLEELKLN